MGTVVNKNASAVDSRVIILIALTIMAFVAFPHIKEALTETAVVTSPTIATVSELKIWKATGEAGSTIDVTGNPGLAGIELSTNSIKNIGASMALIQIEGVVSKLLAPGQAMAINSATRAIYVAHPKEEYIWPDGHGGYYFDFYNKRPKIFPLY